MFSPHDLQHRNIQITSLKEGRAQTRPSNASVGGGVNRRKGWWICHPALSTHSLARQTDGVVPALAPPNQIRLSYVGNASGIQHYPWKNGITIPTHPTQMTQLLPLTAWVALLLQRKWGNALVSSVTPTSHTPVQPRVPREGMASLLLPSPKCHTLIGQTQHAPSWTGSLLPKNK